MRKIVVLSFITLDGVMQAPGGPEEDTSGGFKYGGWLAPYWDDEASKLMEKQMDPADLLLGQNTFEIWEGYWPWRPHVWKDINEVTKYVLSDNRSAAFWLNCEFLPDINAIKKLKESDGGDLRVHGSSVLVQMLLQHDLVDELWLKFFPIILGEGKKLFADNAVPAAFELTETHATQKGVIFANYKKAGQVQTGTVGE